MAAHSQPHLLPPAAGWGGALGSQWGTEEAASSVHLPPSWLAADCSRMWPVVLISFLPPSDDNGCCFCAQWASVPDLPSIASLHPHANPRRLGGRQAILSVAPLPSACGRRPTSPGAGTWAGTLRQGPFWVGVVLRGSWSRW